MYELQKPVDKLRHMFLTNAWSLVLTCWKSRPIITRFGRVKASGEKLS